MYPNIRVIGFPRNEVTEAHCLVFTKEIGSRLFFSHFCSNRFAPICVAQMRPSCPSRIGTHREAARFFLTFFCRFVDAFNVPEVTYRSIPRLPRYERAVVVRIPLGKPPYLTDDVFA